MKTMRRGGVSLRTALCLASVMLTASSAFASEGEEAEMSWQGAWKPATSYSEGSVVRHTLSGYPDGLYVCDESDGCTSTPSPASDDWDFLTDSYYWRGAWNKTSSYSPGDIVQHDGGSYLCIKNAPVGTVPTDATYWAVFAAKGVKGDKGDIGIQGPQGVKGDKGDAGAQGPQGVPGVQGPTGPAGAQGLPGVKGDKGDAGAQGPTGPQGEKGDKGDIGPAGPIGPRGPRGFKGEKGDTGLQGPSVNDFTCRPGKFIYGFQDGKPLCRWFWR